MTEPEVVANGESEAAAAEAAPAPPAEKLKRLPKPDDTEYTAKFEKLNEQINAKNARLGEIKEALDAYHDKRKAGSGEQVELRNKLNDEKARFQSVLVSSWHLFIDSFAGERGELSPRAVRKGRDRVSSGPMGLRSGVTGPADLQHTVPLPGRDCDGLRLGIRSELFTDCGARGGFWRRVGLGGKGRLEGALLGTPAQLSLSRGNPGEGGSLIRPRFCYHSNCYIPDSFLWAWLWGGKGRGWEIWLCAL